MADTQTLRQLLDEIANLRDELAPPEREIFEELQDRLAKGEAVAMGDDRSLEVILRNVKIRQQKGLKLTPRG